MKALNLNRRLVLEAPSRVADGAGGYAVAWSALGTVWAAVAPASPRPLDRPGAEGALLPLRVTLRAAPPGSPRRPEPGQRFREGARLFSVLAVAEEDPLGRYLVCHAREEVAR